MHQDAAETSPSAAPDVDWDEVRRAYELSGETVSSILARFALTPYGLSKRRVAEGWTTRPPAARPGALQGYKPVGSEALALRLSKLVAIGTAMLEKRLAEEGLTDANARTLTELCRAEEIRMRSTRQKTGKTRETKNHDAGHDFRDDPAWLDAEIHRRLERRARREGAEENPGGDEAGGEAGLPRGLAGSVGAG